jgi:hypothetical protein
MHRLLTTVSLAAAVTFVAPLARAASVTVGLTCSMKNAVASLNADAGVGGCVKSGILGINIIYVPAGIFIEQGELMIQRSVQFRGAGRSSTIFNSGGVSAFRTTGTNASVVEFRDMTVKKLDSQPLPCIGIRVLAPARLVLRNVRVADFNSVAAVWLDGGTSSTDGLENTFIDSLIENNLAVGIRSDSADVRVTRSTIANNRGGIRQKNGYVFVDDSTIRDNTVGTGNGGGLYVEGGSGGQLTVNRSLIRNNRATNGYGGGMYSLGQVYFYNNTFTGNRALRGGAYYNVGAESYLYNNTISDNTADERAGGVYNKSSQSLWYYNIIANNTAPTNRDAEVTGITSGYNLVENWNGWGPGSSTNDLVGYDPKLGSLTTYGSTQAFPLLAGSVAIDRIPNNAIGAPTIDQRGHSRPVDGPDGGGLNGYDLGSIEQRP